MTREVDSLEAVNQAAGTGCFAGYTTNGSHAANSYHERAGTPSTSGPIGLAVDFDAADNNASELMVCAELFLSYAPQLAELFHSPLGKWVKNGKVYPISALDAHDVALHYNHVHVAVNKGVFLAPPTKEQAMTLVISPVGAVDRPTHDGGWAFGSHGHVYAYDNAKYIGGWDDSTRNDPSRWCVALVPSTSGNGYWLVSNKGEVYAYGDAPQTGNYQSQWGTGQIIGAYHNDRQANGGVTLIRDDGQHLNPYALPA